MKCRLFATLLFAFSAAFLCFWIRSLNVADLFQFQLSARRYYLDFRPTGLQFGTFPASPSARPSFHHYTIDISSFNGTWLTYMHASKHYYHFAGFQFLYSVPWNISYVTFVIPYWLLTLLPSFPAIHLLRRRQAVPLPGFCKICHYDLRASTERCPECGTPIVSIQSKACPE